MESLTSRARERCFYNGDPVCLYCAGTRASGERDTLI